MRPAGIHHVSINVSDVAVARAFYVDVLGLVERTDRPDFDFDGAWLDAAGQQVHLIAGEVPPRMGQHFAFQVDDLDAVVTELRGRGVRVSDPQPVATALQSFLRDPCGNMVELQEVGGALKHAAAGQSRESSAS
jgi:catechol 2,3-dioxygenase-like lactoylglutathione lyase family enzyme